MTQLLSSLNRKIETLLEDTQQQRERIDRLTAQVDRLCAEQAASDSANADLQALGEQGLRAAEAQKEASKRQLSVAQRRSQEVVQLSTLAK